MKLRLIEPSRYLENGNLLKVPGVLPPSLTLPLLAALTPRDIHVSIVNELVEDIDFDEEVDVVGISSYTISIYRAYEIADEFRKRGVPVVMGGIHVSMQPEEAQEHAGTVIVGEAEETWPQFLDDFRNGTRKKIYVAKKRPSLINLPVPRFSLMDKSRYLCFRRKGLFRLLPTPMLSIQTARGCPHSCDFCSVTLFSGGKYRSRPISDVVGEIKALGARGYFFTDDNIFASPPRAKKLFRALVPLRILWFGQATISAAEDKELIQLARESGCISLFIGLESLSHKSLGSVGKMINKIEDYEKNLKAYRKEGIGVVANMMFGFDDEEPTVFKEAYDFLVKNHVTHAFWFPLTPLPGTRLYEKLKDQGRLKCEKWWLKPEADIRRPRFTGIKMDDGVFSDNFYQYYRRFYSLGSITQRILFPPQKRFLPKLFLNLLYRRKLRSGATVIGY